LVQDYLAARPGLQQERLPVYAPEFHPVEYWWGQLKEQQLCHFCPKHLGQLRGATRKAMGRLQRRQAIVACCWKQAEPPLSQSSPSPCIMQKLIGRFAVFFSRQLEKWTANGPNSR
jgi:hypothetical protein